MTSVLCCFSELESGVASGAYAEWSKSLDLSQGLCTDRTKWEAQLTQGRRLHWQVARALITKSDHAKVRVAGKALFAQNKVRVFGQ